MAAETPPASTSAANSPFANYPILTPAYRFNFRIGGPASPVGGLTRGLPLTVVHIVGGRVSSAPRSSSAKASAGGNVGSSGNEEKEGRQSDAEWREEVGLPVLEATVRGQGIDYVRNDPDGGRMRLDAGLVVEDGEGALVHIHYTGIVDINDGLSAILAGRSDAKSTDYGSSFINVTFESGSEKYRDLERGVFVGAGRFIWDGRGLGVEYKVSRVGWHAP